MSIALSINLQDFIQDAALKKKKLSSGAELHFSVPEHILYLLF